MEEKSEMTIFSIWRESSPISAIYTQDSEETLTTYTWVCFGPESRESINLLISRCSSRKALSSNYHLLEVNNKTSEFTMIKTSVNNCRAVRRETWRAADRFTQKTLGHSATWASSIISSNSKTHPGIGQRDSAPIYGGMDENNVK
jgi:hypothetical protein